MKIPDYVVLKLIVLCLCLHKAGLQACELPHLAKRVNDISESKYSTHYGPNFIFSKYYPIVLISLILF